MLLQAGDSGQLAQLHGTEAGIIDANLTASSRSAALSR